MAPVSARVIGTRHLSCSLSPRWTNSPAEASGAIVLLSGRLLTVAPLRLPEAP